MRAEDRRQIAQGGNDFVVVAHTATRGCQHIGRALPSSFFTDSFTDEVYTPEGMAWIADNTMNTVLTRHCPDLEPLVSDLPNAFGIWQRAGAR